MRVACRSGGRDRSIIDFVSSSKTFYEAFILEQILKHLKLGGI